MRMLAHTVSDIRVPKLHGYVKHAELGCVIGQLREWIPSGLEPLLHELDSVDIGAIPSERDKKCMSQIS